MLKIVQEMDPTRGVPICNNQACPTMSAGSYDMPPLFPAQPRGMLIHCLDKIIPGSINNANLCLSLHPPTSNIFRPGSAARSLILRSSPWIRSPRLLPFHPQPKLPPIPTTGSANHQASRSASRARSRTCTSRCSAATPTFTGSTGSPSGT
jgi:hypothetical protein